MPPRVAVALLDEGQEYHRLQAAEARAAAKRAGLDCQVHFGENNALVQIHQVFGCIHAPEEERPAAIVVHSVTGEGLERVARNAVRAGIGWLILNRRVDYVAQLRTERPDLPIAAVTVDQTEIGRIQGRQIRALLPGGGLILYVQGPADTSAGHDRLQATREALASRPYEWKVVNADWTGSGGERAVATWLRLKTAGGQRPDLIVAQNDAMAVGARRAARAHDAEWGSVPVLGCDGLPEGGRRLVGAGELAATVVLPSSAGPAVELVGRWLQTKAIPPEEVVLAPQGFPADAQLARR